MRRNGNENMDSGLLVSAKLTDMIRNASIREGSQNSFAKKLNVSTKNISNWLGCGSQTNKFISWDIWILVKKYFIAHNEIDPNDPEWMTPSEMRFALLNRDSKQKKDETPIVGEKVPKLDEKDKEALELLSNLNAAGKEIVLSAMRGTVKTLAVTTEFAAKPNSPSFIQGKSQAKIG